MNLAESIAAEEMAGIREAETYLAGYCQCYALLSPELWPAGLREALHSLTIVTLANPLQGELWLADVARAAELPLAELRRQVHDRAEFFNRLPELHKRDPRTTTEVLCKLILN